MSAPTQFYGLPNGLTSNVSPAAVVSGRAPTTSDNGYPLGQQWIFNSLEYILTSVARGSATWVINSASASNLNTLTFDSGGPLSPTANNITINGSANQFSFAGSGSTATGTLSSTLVAPGSITSTTSITSGTSVSVGTTLAVTGNATIGGTLAVTGGITLGSITANGTINLNTSGAGVTTINTGGTGALALGNATGNTTLTGSFSTLTAGGTFAIGTAAQTGQTTIVSSTAANDVVIQGGINVGTQTVSISNGATAATSTVNILSGAGSAGAAALHMADNARVTAISLGNVAPAAARTTDVLGGNSAQNDTLNVLNGAPSAGTQTISLLSGTATGGTQALNLGNGIGGALTVSIGNGVNTTAQTVNIANGASAGNSTVNILSGAASSGTLALNLGNGAGPKTVAIATGVSGNTVNVATGINTSAQTVNIASGASGANSTVSIMSGAATAGVQVVNISSGATGVNSTVNILSGNASAGTQTLNLATGTGGKVVHIADAAAVNTVTIGSTNSTSATTIQAGSGNVNLTGNVVKSTNSAFLGYLAASALNKTGDGTSYTLGTDALTAVYNRGSNFNTNGTYTAPVTGLYDLRSQITITGATIATTFVISIVTTARTYKYTFIKAAGSQDETVAVSALADMTAADTATVTIAVTGEAAATDDIKGGATLETYFCGCLVG